MKHFHLLVRTIVCGCFAASIAACGNSSAQTAAPASAAVDSTVADSAKAAPAENAQSLTLAFTGDIMMGTTFPDSVHGSYLPPDDGRHLFDDAAEVLRSADLTMGNLEGTMLDGPGKRRPMRNPNTYYVFRMPTSYVGNLTAAGFDCLGMANNHVNDFGEPGRRSTMTTLRDAALAYVGLKGRCETAVIERKGLKIGLTQFGHGGGNLDVNDLGELRRVVAQLRDTADLVIVSFHGGAEGKDCTHVPHAPETFLGERRGNVESFAHAAIDAGADVVFGHGPHVPRAAELYKDRIIFYSLGNFCTPYRVSITGVSGYASVAEVTVGADGRFLSGRIHSFIQQRGIGSRADATNAAARLIRRLSAEDFPGSPLRISPDGALTPGS